MIARIWHGYTNPDHADAYEAMLKPELLPGISKAKGYRGSYLLRRKSGDEGDHRHYKVEFENERVRVLRIKYGPGEKSVVHSVHLPGRADVAFRSHAARAYCSGLSSNCFLHSSEQK